MCLVTQSCPTLCDPMDCSPPGCSVHGDSPGKDTGVSCHALLQGIFPIQGSNPGLLHCRQILYQLSHPSGPTPGPIPVLCLVAQSCPTLCNPMDCRQPGSSVRGDSPSRNTGEGCHALLQGIFPIQGSNPGLSHCRWLPYQLNHKGRPK